MSTGNASSSAAPAQVQATESGQAAAAQYYKHHVFFCLNERVNGETSCAQFNAKEGFDQCKRRVRDLGLAGPGGVRTNKAGCLDRCAGGPVVVVYPEGVWYTYVDAADIEEIVDRHLKAGEIVERLVLPPTVGR